MGINSKLPGQKYVHYIELIRDLSENYIQKDKELLQLVDSKLSNDAYFRDENRYLLAQDILYQAFNKYSEENYWIFQGNPQVFDVVSALKDNNLKTWLVNAHKKSIKKGDKIILWLTGKMSGCYALGEVTSDVFFGKDDNVESQYYLKPEENNDSDRVKIKITHNLHNDPILRHQIENIAELKDLKAGVQGTNFSSNKAEYDALLLIASRLHQSNSMDNKENFRNWLLKNFAEKSGAVSAYISSIDWLSERFFEKKRISTKSIFDINDIDLINLLYNETKSLQKDPTSYIYNVDAPSYGEKNFYSASLNKYKEFLMSNNLQLTKEIKSFDNIKAVEEILKIGLVFSNQLIARFTSSLLTKPFVILTGLSGSGKTKLAQAFAMWLCENETQYKIVPVGADWTNREPLLGFPNALKQGAYVKPDSGVLDLIIRATQNGNKPYFLILDEMNLSHVERYFADFLSTMESGEEILLHAGDENWGDVPARISLPKNLFIVGTVNIDETTYMFSPKVLDRANVIEFRVTAEEMESYLKQSGKVDLDILKGQGAAMEQSFVELAKNRDLAYKNQPDMNETLVSFFRELKNAGAEFGYRTAAEIQRFAAVTEALETNWTTEQILDVVIMQKLLPKLHGSRKKLVPVLETLIKLCVDKVAKAEDFYQYKEGEDKTMVLYPIALEKLQRMYRGLLDNGFSSYAEA